jgi:hypothetical protein
VIAEGSGGGTAFFFVAFKAALSETRADPFACKLSQHSG